MSALSVIGVPSIIAVILAKPVPAPEVKVSEYVPLLLSVGVPEVVPRVELILTVWPPVVILFPKASFNIRDIVDVL